MSTYSFDEFKNNILNITDSNNTYFWEILLTDFYCFQKEIDPEKIYISKPINDGKIDSIIIPKSSNDTTIKNIHILQISTTSKDYNYINEFLNIVPYELSQYKDLLHNYKDEKKYTFHKVLITFNYNNIYSNFDTLEIISGDELFESIFENSIRYKLIHNKNSLNQEYINNINKRVTIWKELHRFEVYSKEIIDSFIYFILINHSAIKTGNFNLISDLNSIWKISSQDALSTLKFFNSDYRNKLIESNDDTFFILMTIFRYGKNLNSNFFNLVKNINLLKQNNSTLKKISIEPTKDYLSIKYNEKTIAYLQYVYNKPKKENVEYRKSRFSFKCNFNKLFDEKSTLPSLVNSYLDNGRLVSTKEENKNKTGASHTGMSTSLIHPSEADYDWEVIEFLLCRSLSYI